MVNSKTIAFLLDSAAGGVGVSFVWFCLYFWYFIPRRCFKDPESEKSCRKVGGWGGGGQEFLELSPARKLQTIYMEFKPS
jgi:hypothetical protein